MSLALSVVSVCRAQVSTRFGLGGGAGEHRTTILIKADGSSIVTNVTVQSRTVTEQGIRAWERWQKQSEGAGDADEPAADAVKKPAEVKPYTDEELTAKIRETEKLSSEQSGSEPQKVESIELTTNSVRIVMTRAFASLSDLLAQSGAVIGAILPMDNVRFEKTNEQLRVTLTPSPGMQRYAKSVRQQWKSSGGVSEIRFIFPGKVIASGLPNTKDNVTWVAVEGDKAETLDALMKLYDAPTIILCELGGLKLDTPLDSKKLLRFARQPGADAGENVPITDAGPGFVAEGVSVTTSTLHYFPEGEKYLKDAWQFGLNNTGLTVRAKLFAPKDRSIKSASGVRVLKAVDDKGREIGSLEGQPESDYSFSMPSGRSKSAPVVVTLRLSLPAADAGSISELSGEAIALTVGKWKEFSLTNLQANATNEIDLSSILPGATLALTKVSTRNQQLQVQAKLKGPKEIRQLELQCQKPGSRQFNTYANDMNFSTKGGQSTRTVNVQGYGFGEEGGGAIVLVVRSPDDLRRERVRFSLKELDLF